MQSTALVVRRKARADEGHGVPPDSLCGLSAEQMRGNPGMQLTPVPAAGSPDRGPTAGTTWPGSLGPLEAGPQTLPWLCCSGGDRNARMAPPTTGAQAEPSPSSPPSPAAGDPVGHTLGGQGRSLEEGRESPEKAQKDPSAHLDTTAATWPYPGKGLPMLPNLPPLSQTGCPQLGTQDSPSTAAGAAALKVAPSQCSLQASGPAWEG